MSRSTKALKALVRVGNVKDSGAANGSNNLGVRICQGMIRRESVTLNMFRFLGELNTTCNKTHIVVESN
jgi:hypothetical protein